MADNKKIKAIFDAYQDIHTLYKDSTGRLYFTPNAKENLEPIYRDEFFKPKPKKSK